MNTFIVKYAAFVNALAFVILIATGNFFCSSPIIIIAQIFAFVFILYSRISFGKQEFSVTAVPGSGPLVQRGPYKLIRHPLYAGVLLLLWVSIIGHWKILTVLIGLIDTVGIIWRINLEERLLRERYPEYADYASRTKKVIPYIY